MRDVIVSGGFNVCPRDVEAALVRHPAVYECVVFSLPDEKWGETPMALIVLRSGQTPSEEEILDYCRTPRTQTKIIGKFRRHGQPEILAALAARLALRVNMRSMSYCLR